MTLSLAFGWRHLLFANWPVDPHDLDDRVPDPLDVQTFDNTAWVSVIPFRNVDVRPRGLPRRVGIDVPEVNVRTYVTHEDEPGVYFFSLDAQDVLTVLGARFTHQLPYFYAEGDIAMDADRVRFESRRRQPGDPPAAVSATYAGVGSQFLAPSGSLSAFLTERHRLYTLAPSGSLRYTDVRHERWPLYEAEADLDVTELFTANRLAIPDSEPVLYYSPGVDVITSRSKRWRFRRPDTPGST